MFVKEKPIYFLLTGIIVVSMFSCLGIPNNKIIATDKEVSRIFCMRIFDVLTIFDFNKKTITDKDINFKTQGAIGYRDNYFYFPVKKNDHIEIVAWDIDANAGYSLEGGNPGSKGSFPVLYKR